MRTNLCVIDFILVENFQRLIVDPQTLKIVLLGVSLVCLCEVLCTFLIRFVI